jgi:hypothetical protein
MAGLTPEQLDIPEAYIQMRQLPSGLYAGVLGVAQMVDPGEHERTYELHTSTTPNPIQMLASIMITRFNQPLNTAVVTQYSPGAASSSAAYEPHVDPRRYGGKIMTVSLSGHAKLYTRRSGETAADFYRLDPGTALAMSARVLHWVSPPSTDETRHMIFFGFDTAKPVQKSRRTSK